MFPGESTREGISLTFWEKGQYPPFLRQKALWVPGSKHQGARQAEAEWVTFAAIFLGVKLPTFHHDKSVTKIPIFT